MSNWKYTDSSKRSVIRDLDNGYQEVCLVEAIADWIAEGNTPEPADPLPIPVITVSPWQIRKALNELSLRESVELAVRNADQTTQDAWQYATEFIETDPLVLTLGAALGKSPEELHQLFELAKSL